MLPHFLSDHTVCQTVHLYDIHAGQSVAVHKRCALASQCTEDMVGCRETHQPGIMVSAERTVNIDGLVQESRNSIANTLELRLSCTN